MATVQPVPIFTLPIVLDDKKYKTPEERIENAEFSPIWLKWFIDLVGTLNAAGGTVLTGESLNIALPARIFDPLRQQPTLFQPDSQAVLAGQIFGS